MLGGLEGRESVVSERLVALCVHLILERPVGSMRILSSANITVAQKSN